MTSLSRRKRPTTARRITPTRTIASLFCLGWLAGGAVGGDQPLPLRPLVQPLPPADLPAPSPLVPATRPQTMPQPKGLISYQKDPGSAKTVALPMANTTPSPMGELAIPQEQVPQPGQPGRPGTQPGSELP